MEMSAHEYFLVMCKAVNQSASWAQSKSFTIALELYFAAAQIESIELLTGLTVDLTLPVKFMRDRVHYAFEQ